MTLETQPIALETVLRQRFALEHFRPGQREVIEKVLQGLDVLCVMPTGGGKSLCYQLPALLLPGVTLVVSPLIALMKDQVDALSARGANATFLNSTLDPDEVMRRIAETESARFALVYVAPERFRSSRFVEAMARVRPSLFAVDEAHCISEWGHDFRPDYARLGAARRNMGMPPCIALTATATELVRRDIAEQLQLNDPELFVTGFDRPNLHYRVVPASRDDDKHAALGEALKRHPGPAIVYANSRKRCEEVGAALDAPHKGRVVVYHAGLDREARDSAQDRFMSGDAEIVVATNAFGMGVDKADVRSVIHFNMPGTLEAYYQEAGRAGRDGRPAQCVLLYAPSDRFLQEMFIDNAYPPPESFFQVYQFLRALDADPIELTHAEIQESARLAINETGVGTVLKRLEDVGVIERFRPWENKAIARLNTAPGEPPLSDRLSARAHVQRIVMIALEGLIGRRFGEPVYFQPDEFAAALGLDRVALTRALKELSAELPFDYVPPFRGNAIRVLDRSRTRATLGVDFGALEERRQAELAKLDLMVRYAESRGCRRSYILEYFGDTSAPRGPCGRCDGCAPRDAFAGPISGDPIDTPEGRQVLLKALSGVARAQGRFGANKIAQMLAGSASESMSRSGLNRLSTHGILGADGFTGTEIGKLLNALRAAGLVGTESVGTDRPKPVLVLTELGWAYLKDRAAPAPVLALEPDLIDRVRRGGLNRERPSADGAATAAREGGPLEDALRRRRQEWAAAAGLKAFHVFSNQVLEAIVRARPTTLDELARVKGMGPAKLAQYGPGVLETVAGARSPREAPAPTDSGAPVSSEEWTWRLIERGFTLDDAAAIRGVDRATITAHALAAVRRGKPVPLDAFLPPDVQERWRAWLRDHGDQPPPNHLGGRSIDWPLFRACRS